MYVDGILLKVVFITYKNDIPCADDPDNTGAQIKCVNTDSDELPLEPLLPELGPNSAYPPPHVVFTPPHDFPDGQVCQVDTRPLDCADAERSSQYSSQDAYIAPAEGKLQYGFGLEPNNGGVGIVSMNHGVEIIHENNPNTENIDERYCKPVFAVADGYVAAAVSRTSHRNFSSYGLFLRIDHYVRIRLYL